MRDRARDCGLGGFSGIMKKKTMIAGGSIIIILILAAAALFALNRNGSASNIEINLYFINESSSTIIPEKRKVRYETEYDIPGLVLAALQKGPAEKKHQPVIGKDVDISSIAVENGTVTCNFSKNFLSDDKNKTILSVYAVVKTLCQVEGVKTVKVLAGGHDIIAPDGKPVDYLSDQDINLEDDSESPEAKDIVLYFASKDKKRLVKEQRTIRITDKQPVEQYIVNELIKGPENKDAGAVLTSDTTLVSAETTDGTCFVNFKSNFADKNSGGTDKENLAVYAIVNSLTELEGVKNVQFLIDGKKTDSFGAITIRDFLYRNEGLIEK